MQTVRNIVALPSKDASVGRFCADVFVEIGVAVQNSGDASTALELFADALEVCPQHDVAIFEMGVLAMAQGNKEDAIALYQRAAQANPANVQVLPRFSPDHTLPLAYDSLIVSDSSVFMLCPCVCACFGLWCCTCWKANQHDNLHNRWSRGSSCLTSTTTINVLSAFGGCAIPVNVNASRLSTDSLSWLFALLLPFRSQTRQITHL